MNQGWEANLAGSIQKSSILTVVSAPSLHFHLRMKLELGRDHLNKNLGNKVSIVSTLARSFKQFNLCFALLVALLTVLNFTGSRCFAASSCAFALNDQTRIIETRFGEVQLTSDTAIQLLDDQNEIEAALSLKGSEKKAALKNYFEQKNTRRIDTALTYVNYSVAMGIGTQLAIELIHQPVHALTSAALIPPTLFISDMVSGFFHKWLDSFASEKNPLWGSSARAFRKHHEFPANLNELTYTENISAFSQLMAPLYAATAIAQPHLAPEVTSSLLLTLMLFSNGTEIHRQAHLSKPSGWAKRLQDWKILLSRKDHVRHHHEPNDSNFGIINGWSDSVTAKLWNRLDLILWKATRKMPGNWIQNPRSIPLSVLIELQTDIQALPQELVVSARDERESSEQIDQLISLWIDRHAALESGLDKETQNGVLK